MNEFLSVERTQSDESGEPRRAGFELEFSGLSLAEVGETVAAVMQGELETHNKAESVVRTPRFGKFKIELDWQLGKEIARRRREEQGAEAAQQEDPLMDWLTAAAAEIVPVEVVCPPIEFDELKALNELVSALRTAGAVGTGASPVYAFGVHINPDLPDLKATTIADYLKAFCLAQAWLVKANKVDLSRRITPYIDLFPDSYVACVLEYDSSVTEAQLIDDYARHNPTRNRALDMTPLFKHLDEARLTAAIDDDRINARPTFHYRLPNCSIEDPEWSLSTCWNLWCLVEHLSLQPSLMDEMRRMWRTRRDNLITLDEPPWHETLDHLYQDLLSA